MLKSIEQIIDSQLNSHIIRDCDLAYLFKGTSARRYGLVNKALKKGELIRICRGFYTLPSKYQKHMPNQYYFANRIVPNSFITAESALSFHGWTPERVVQTISLVALARKKKFNTAFGEFIYETAPIEKKLFYFGVKLIEKDNNFIYMATPLRALIDYIYMHKVENANINFLKNSLRIDEESIYTLTKDEVESLKPVYRSNIVKKFLNNLTLEMFGG